MITILTYWWNEPGFPNTYVSDDVKRLQRMVSQNTTVPHEFAVVTDRVELFADEPDIRAIPICWDKHVPRTCSVRLMTFHPEGASMIGERVFQMDLDTIVVGNIDAIVSRTEDTVLWRNPSRVPWDKPGRPQRPLYNGSFVSHRCGAAPHVWNEYIPDRCRWIDDQTWLSLVFGIDTPYFDGEHDGVYRLARQDTPGSGVWGSLPDNARIVTCPGDKGKPRDPIIRAANPWMEPYLEQGGSGWA